MRARPRSGRRARRQQHDHRVPLRADDRLAGAERGDEAAASRTTSAAIAVRSSAPRWWAMRRQRAPIAAPAGKAAIAVRTPTRQPRRAREREAEEHDVARHVRDEDVPERDVADGVDDARDDGEAEQHERQRAMLAYAARRSVHASPGGAASTRSGSGSVIAPDSPGRAPGAGRRVASLTLAVSAGPKRATPTHRDIDAEIPVHAGRQPQLWSNSTGRSWRARGRASRPASISCSASYNRAAAHDRRPRGVRMWRGARRSARSARGGCRDVCGVPSQARGAP